MNDNIKIPCGLAAAVVSMETSFCKWRLVADAWRARLGRGPWTAGARLPPTDELGREFGVSARPAQQALLSLSREGLVERAPGRGTLVTEKAVAVAREADAARAATVRPRRVALLADVSAPVSPYGGRLLQLLQDELARCGVDARVRFVHPERPGFAAALAEDIRETRFAAAFCAFCPPSRDAFRALRLPIPLLGWGRFTYSADASRLDLFETIAERLRKAGAKRPAFITNLRPEVAASAFAPDGLEDLPGKDLDGIWAARFRLALSRFGIRANLSRVAFGFPEDIAVRDPASVGASACAATKRQLAMRPAPDALVVHPDVLVPGAVAAILESGLKVPRDLKCIFHCNIGMEPFVPFPCEWIANDVSENARRWAGLLCDVLDDRPLPREFAPNLLPAADGIE